MDWFLLNHLKWFVVIVYCAVSSIYVCMKLLYLKANRQPFVLYIGISCFDFNEGLGSEGNCSAVLDEGYS